MRDPRRTHASFAAAQGGLLQACPRARIFAVDASARAEVGHGLRPLLNLTDGLLGQGVRCVLLVTTNEPIGRLHPAVRRPGRCWMSIDVGPFDPAEATARLALQDVDREVPRPATLAELYAIVEDREREDGSGAEGFGSACALTR